MSGSLFDFPHPVNEVSARLVAGGVVLMSAATVALDVAILHSLSGGHFLILFS